MTPALFPNEPFGVSDFLRDLIREGWRSVHGDETKGRQGRRKGCQARCQGRSQGGSEGWPGRRQGSLESRQRPGEAREVGAQLAGAEDNSLREVRVLRPRWPGYRGPA